MTTRIRATNADVTGIVNTHSAAVSGILNDLHDSHLAKPDDVSIVAVISPRIADLMIPPPTTVDFPVEEMTHIGVESLIAQLGGKLAEQAGAVSGRSSPFARAPNP